LENLIEAEANQNIINEVKKVFSTITQYLDYVIAILFPSDLLKTTNPNLGNKSLSLTKIFNFEDNDVD
jgi:hypothetical protein